MIDPIRIKPMILNIVNFLIVDKDINERKERLNQCIVIEKKIQKHLTNLIINIVLEQIALIILKNFGTCMTDIVIVSD